MTRFTCALLHRANNGLDTGRFRSNNFDMIEPDALDPQRPARTVGQLRAALSGLPDDMPVIIEGEGLLEAVQAGDAGAGEAKIRTGFVDDPNEHRVDVLWLLGEVRAA